MYRVNKILVAVVALCALLPSALVCGDNNPADIASAKAQYEASAKARPVVFIPNRGQIVDSDGNLRPDLLYSSSGGGVQMYFRRTGISYVFARVEEQPKPANSAISEATGKPMYPAEESMEEPLVSVYRMDMELEGCNTNAEVLGEEQTKEYFNYYLAHCPDGITNVHGYKRVVYKNIYDSIDLVFHSSKYGVKYDFVVRPGGDVHDIKMRYDNAESIALKAGRKLQLNTPLGKLQEDAPITYSIANGSYRPLTMNGRPVRSHFVLDGSTIGFDVEQYDHNQTLVIDPYVLWSTYMGSGAKEHIEGVTVRTYFNGYADPDNVAQETAVTGWTVSAGFPVDAWANKKVGVNKGKTDAFLASISAEGELQWYTYFGGKDFDRADAIACANPYRYSNDDNYNKSLYAITGRTRSRETIGSVGSNSSATVYQNTFGGGEADAFVATFNAAGQRLWSTYLGGENAEYGHDIAIYVNGNSAIIGVVGQTESTDFPVWPENSPADWRDDKVMDAFLTTFADDGTLQWSRYFGGDDEDAALAVDVNASGNWAIGGWTRSKGGIQDAGANAGNIDMIVAIFSSAGDRLAASYLGGGGNDYCTSVAYDYDKNIVIGGYADQRSESYYQNFKPSYQYNYGGGSYDGVLLKTSPTFQDEPLWATLYGGDNDDRIEDIAVDYYGDIWIVGRTNSSPTTNIADGRLVNYKWDNTTHDWEVLQDERIPSFNGGVPRYDTFLAKFDTDGQRTWSSYYGRTGSNIGVSISSGYFYGIAVAGWTQFGEQIDIPTFNAGNLQANPDGCDGGFVMLMREFGFPTFYGRNTYSVAVDVDSKDNIVIIGAANLSDNPIIPITQGAHQTTLQANRSATIFKIDSTGAPIWSTLYGGQENTWLAALDISPDDDIVVSGTRPENSGHIALFNKDGVLINSATMAGGNGDKTVFRDAQFSPDGNIVAFGYTNNTQYVGYSGGAYDGLIVRYSAGLADMSWLRCWGGSDADALFQGRITSSGEIIAAGATRSQSSSFPPYNGCTWHVVAEEPARDANYYQNILVTKFDCSGDPVWSSSLGGGFHEYFSSMELLSESEVVITGSTESLNFPITIDAIQHQLNQGEPNPSIHFTDIFITKLSTITGNINWSTYLGDKWGDDAVSIAVDNQGAIILELVAEASSTNYIYGIQALYTPYPYRHGYGIVKIESNNHIAWGKLLREEPYYNYLYGALIREKHTETVGVTHRNRYFFAPTGMDNVYPNDRRGVFLYGSKSWYMMLDENGGVWRAP